jgi:hypothetical protein
MLKARGVERIGRTENRQRIHVSRITIRERLTNHGFCTRMKRASVDRFVFALVAYIPNGGFAAAYADGQGIAATFVLGGQGTLLRQRKWRSGVPACRGIAHPQQIFRWS